MSSIKEVKVPDIGDFKEVDVIEVLVKPGDAVAKEASLITVESDKATMEIPSPAAGRVQELKVKIGDKVSEGSMILLLEESADAAAAPPESATGSVPPEGITLRETWPSRWSSIWPDTPLCPWRK